MQGPFPGVKKHDGRDHVAGRGEGVHEIPTVVTRTGLKMASSSPRQVEYTRPF